MTMHMLGTDDCPACLFWKKKLAPQIASGEINVVDLKTRGGMEYLDRVERKLGIEIQHTPTFVKEDEKGEIVSACEAALDEKNEPHILCDLPKRRKKR